MARKRPTRTPGAHRTKNQKRTRRWSARVTRESDALDLKKGVFSKRSPKAIARSLKRSAERSHRRKSDPYRSAMSMLTFYINRTAGTCRPAARKFCNEPRKNCGRNSADRLSHSRPFQRVD
jgi:hypothetical protein